MYRALGVGYKKEKKQICYLDIKKKEREKSMYLFDFIPCIKSTF